MMEPPTTLDAKFVPASSKAKRNVVEEFCKSKGGKRPIQRILVANNGMAATKAIMSMRQWAYANLGDERAIEFVAMATGDDLNANAEFVRLADTYVEVPSGSNKNNYADVDLIVKIAVEQGVDGVWPGWGHASENPKLPATLQANDIQFIGPTAPVMAALGDKVSANILAQTAEVPSIPWSGGGITSKLNDEGVIPKDVFDSACVFTADEAEQRANDIGYPVMIKASEGGGGKGIRMAKDVEELRTNFLQVQNEVPGSPIFMMQLCTNARHLEVQIVGDEYGNAVALNGRDCSTQRRFQKIFEEGPPIVAPRDTFRQMELAAQRLTQEIGYIGAGTVEYLYNAADDKYYFLELNPRLQVEHPVTEGITGVNMPSVQLQVAMGIPLDRIAQIRDIYGREPSGTDKIDFLKDEYTLPERHVIAARITAENPDEGFKPTSGRIERVKFQSTPKVWGYFSVGANGGIHEFADSQFGHIFASGPTREDARKQLVLALKDMDVRGDIRTTVEYLIKLLETQEFKDNTIDTAWLDGIIREKSVSVQVPGEQVALSAAIFRSHALVTEKMAELMDALSKGQFSLQGLPSMLNFPVEIVYEDVKYSFEVTAQGPDYYKIKIDGGQEVDVRIREQPDASLLCSVGSDDWQLFGQEDPLGLRMKINGATIMIPPVYNPSELRSDVTGKVVRFLQQDGDKVEKDQPYVEVEAMKMIMALKAGEAGVISQKLQPGAILGPGDLIAGLTLDDPSKVKKIESFSGPMTMLPAAPSRTTEDLVETISNSLDGYSSKAADDAILSYLDVVGSAEEAGSTFGNLLSKFLATETLFENGSEEDVIGALVKENKESLDKVVPSLLARSQSKSRAETVMSLLRQVEYLPERFNFDPSEMPDVLKEALTGLAASTGNGEISLKAKQLVEVATMPSFGQRLADLKAILQKGKADLNALSKEPNIAVSVDLLTVLMSDPDASIRRNAMEVYIRRVYRAHCIEELDITDNNGVLTAKWSFTLREKVEGTLPTRYGYMAMHPNFNDVAKVMPSVVKDGATYFSESSGGNDNLNVLHLGFHNSGDLSDDDSAKKCEATVATLRSDLEACNLRSVNILNVNPGKAVSYYNFYSDNGFTEDSVSRNMRPTMPYLLELNRLKKNHILEKLPTVGRNSQLYLGKEISDTPVRGGPPSVLFLRSISLSKSSATMEGAERLVALGLDEIERASLDPRVSPTTSSRIYLNILSDVGDSVDQTVKTFQTIMDSLISKYATRLLKLNVDEIEVKIRVKDSNGDILPIRLIASSSTGGWLTREAYREYLDPITGQTLQYCTLTNKDLCVMDPYPTSNVLQRKRAAVRRIGSTYATDFLGLLEVANIKSWTDHFEQLGERGSIPSSAFTFDELVMGADGELRKEKRFPGTNKVGMLAWTITMKTPAYPEGRDIVVIANDVTVQSGSFGVQEDEFFYKASEYARLKGLPRIFISCNSGARIGLVDELKSQYKVAWKDESNPLLGFDYLYLTETTYKSLAPGTVQATEKMVNGETRYVLDAIIGQVHGIGVENLRGSGLIAGETSRAYEDTFTLSYVTGRSVGIGAYLNRLGQRVIQMQKGPMILTGYSALNKLLGKEVYTSQDQLGGPQIMYPNGIAHEIVKDDGEGVQSIVDWLSYIPKDFHSVAPSKASGDRPERPIEFTPTKTPYDPRHMLAGTTGPDGKFMSGFFDKGSFKEYLGGWGKSVVTGRARLGGINVGVIAVETRLVEQRIPADPGNPESREDIKPQAGQVWYPDSAYKTAQAIQDFNRGENLPLMIFANWRGFSGGTRDMYGEVLKFGAMIVDALRDYKHPVFVYIPPGGELRGGAWVVIDPTINEKKMEMYADKDARGGILEPPGICEVKYRGPEQKLAMGRLDPQIIEFTDSLSASSSDAEADSMKADIAEREKALGPLYTQIAHEFADLHDRSGRMKAKGVISEELEWKSSRTFFFWRIKRRLAEDSIIEKMVAATDGAMDYGDAKARVQSMIPSNSDKEVVAWIEANQGEINGAIKAAKIDHLEENLRGAVAGLSAAEIAGILNKLT